MPILEGFVGEMGLPLDHGIHESEEPNEDHKEGVVEIESSRGTEYTRNLRTHTVPAQVVAGRVGGGVVRGVPRHCAPDISILKNRARQHNPL